MKKLKEFVFVLENCEAVTIESKYIGNFNVENIRSTIVKHYNDISHYKICETFSIAINKEASKDYYVFGINDEEHKQSTFKRLTYGDIVSIEIVYEDDIKEDFYVDWQGDSEYLNEAQKTYISKRGDLFIVISKEKSVESQFKHWNIDSEKGSMNTMWEINLIK
ncbi:hypothetical protein MHB54_00620 [Paenibacillus sp. FSL M7-0802]|uniref:hypothetical protein n=1 Tax=Paenibacillus sp. FSL M7-0802 TaxID=2921536 RepID=UPI0030F5253C